MRAQDSRRKSTHARRFFRRQGLVRQRCCRESPRFPWDCNDETRRSGGPAKQVLHKQREHRGRSVKGTAPTRKRSTAPTARLRSLRTRRLTMGCSVRSSQIRKNRNVTAEITERVTIKGDENQSSVWPLSRTICKLLTQRISKPKPTVSMRPGRASRSQGGSSRKEEHIITESTPTGRLMKNTQRHDIVVRDPSPEGGAEKQAPNHDAHGIDRHGRTTFFLWERFQQYGLGSWAAALLRPRLEEYARRSTCRRLVANPHKIEASVNTPMQVIRNRFRPK